MRMLVVFLVGCGGASAIPDAAIDAAAPRPDAPADAAPPFCPAATAPAGGDVQVAGEPNAALGIFDPSVIYPSGAPAGAMAYSAVPDQTTIRTHLAVSNDHGASWTYVAEPNVPEAATIPSSDATECPGGACTGNLISEVSSLIYDPADPDATRRWKLFAHRYLVGAGVNLHYRIGTITLQTAAQVQGPWTAPEKLIGWTSPAAYTSTGVATNASTLPGTADCIALTEPGALALPGALDLAVGCVYLAGNAPKIRIELLRSTDHGASWQSVATLLRPDDAACFAAGASINAGDLFVSGGVEYLAATPSDTTGYHGCLVFTIDDVVAGHVHRDAMGRAVVTRTIAPASGQFSGACTYADGTGYLLDLGFFGEARKFRIFATP